MITSEQLNKRKQLMHLLRHKEEWPAGFEWNFGRHDDCAMGLAAMAGLIGIGQIGIAGTQQMREAMGFTWEQSQRIFLYGDIDNYNENTEDINTTTTPEFVADMIERITRLDMIDQQGEGNADSTL